MITVQIDNNRTITDIGGIRTMPDLVEFIKANIDPDRIITELTLLGRKLSDADWRAPLSVQGNGVLQVTTGSKTEYCIERLTFAVACLEQICFEFSEAEQKLSLGDTGQGNVVLGGAVADLNAFIGWYNTLLTLIGEEHASRREAFQNSLTTLLSTCERLLQQQLYQSWWAISETIRGQLSPQLKQLGSFCEEMATLARR